MPTEHMDDTLTIREIETKALGVPPLPPPPRALGALAPVPFTWLPGTVRPCRHIGAINTQYQHGAAVASGRDGGAALLDSLRGGTTSTTVSPSAMWLVTVCIRSLPKPTPVRAPNNVC